MEESNDTNSNSSQNSRDGCQSHTAMITFPYIFSLVLGQPLSARLLWITLSSKHLNVLSCNLAVFHLLQYCFFYAQLVCIYIAPNMQAPLYKFTFVYVQVGSSLQLCFIYLERFIAVIHPTYFPLLKKYRCREICVAVVWILSITLAVLFMFSINLNSVEDMAAYLPMCLMVTLSCIMVFTSMKVTKVLRNPTVGKESIHPVKKRAFITICVTCAVAMTCYIPVTVMQQFYVRDEDKYRCIMVPLCIFFLSTASFVHPMFYLYAKGEFSCRRCTK